MEKKVLVKTELEMINLGRRIGSLAFPNMVITVEGSLGAGKTVLAKGIGQGLGVTDVINSPTFTIMKIYQGRLTFYHLDVYRLSSGSDDFDLEEYFESDGVSFIEWAHHIEELLPDNLLKVEINVLEDLSREVIFKSFGSKYNEILTEVVNYENNDN